MIDNILHFPIVPRKIPRSNFFDVKIYLEGGVVIHQEAENKTHSMDLVLAALAEFPGARKISVIRKG